MRTFSLIKRPRRKFSCPTSFETTDLPELLDKLRTFPLMWGPRCDFCGPTSFEIAYLSELLDKLRISFLGNVEPLA